MKLKRSWTCCQENPINFHCLREQI